MRTRARLPTRSYNNETLAGSTDFRVIKVEIWGFAPSSGRSPALSGQLSEGEPTPLGGGLLPAAMSSQQSADLGAANPMQTRGSFCNLVAGVFTPMATGSRSRHA